MKTATYSHPYYSVATTDMRDEGVGFALLPATADYVSSIPGKYHAKSHSNTPRLYSG